MNRQIEIKIVSLIYRQKDRYTERYTMKNDRWLIVYNDIFKICLQIKKKNIIYLYSQIDIYRSKVNINIDR